jgi:3-oxoacyl-[acyl-carrier-protein] synthase II
MARSVVITGIGLVTPLGRSPREILERIRRGEVAASKPPFDVGALSCPFCAPIPDFDAEQYFPENKTLRLMNRDAQMAVVAAHLAMEDAGVKADETYPAEKIALYGSTGVSSMSVEEITRIIEYAAGSDGSLDLKRFGQIALRRVRPVLSFRILANMPICFVSIFENIRGQNAVYTPWEGNGAQAIAAGIRAIRRGDVPCALVGSCDVKTRELSFINLQQLGVFESWSRYGKGSVPGEGAAFLVLEDEDQVTKRGKRAYAKITDYRIRSACSTSDLKDTLLSVISEMKINPCLRRGKLVPAQAGMTVIAAGDGDVVFEEDEQQVFEQAGFEPPRTNCSPYSIHYQNFLFLNGLNWSIGAGLLRPKANLGNLFAAAAAVQVGLAAELAVRGASCVVRPNYAIRNTQFAIRTQPVLAICFGYGSEQASFVLEPVCHE